MTSMFFLQPRLHSCAEAYMVNVLPSQYIIRNDPRDPVVNLVIYEGNCHINLMSPARFPLHDGCAYMKE